MSFPLNNDSSNRSVPHSILNSPGFATRISNHHGGKVSKKQILGVLPSILPVNRLSDQNKRRSLSNHLSPSTHFGLPVIKRSMQSPTLSAVGNDHGSLDGSSLLAKRRPAFSPITLNRRSNFNSPIRSPFNHFHLASPLLKSNSVTSSSKSSEDVQNNSEKQPFVNRNSVLENDESGPNQSSKALTNGYVESGYIDKGMDDKTTEDSLSVHSQRLIEALRHLSSNNRAGGLETDRVAAMSDVMRNAISNKRSRKACQTASSDDDDSSIEDQGRTNGLAESQYVIRNKSGKSRSKSKKVRENEISASLSSCPTIPGMRDREDDEITDDEVKEHVSDLVEVNLRKRNRSSVFRLSESDDQSGAHHRSNNSMDGSLNSNSSSQQHARQSKKRRKKEEKERKKLKKRAKHERRRRRELEKQLKLQFKNSRQTDEIKTKLDQLVAANNSQQAQNCTTILQENVSDKDDTLTRTIQAVEKDKALQKARVRSMLQVFGDDDEEEQPNNSSLVDDSKPKCSVTEADVVSVTPSSFTFGSKPDKTATSLESVCDLSTKRPLSTASVTTAETKSTTSSFSFGGTTTTSASLSVGSGASSIAPSFSFGSSSSKTPPSSLATSSSVVPPSTSVLSILSSTKPVSKTLNTNTGEVSKSFETPADKPSSIPSFSFGKVVTPSSMDGIENSRNASSFSKPTVETGEKNQSTFTFSLPSSSNAISSSDTKPSQGISQTSTISGSNTVVPSFSFSNLPTTISSLPTPTVNAGAFSFGGSDSKQNKSSTMASNTAAFSFGAGPAPSRPPVFGGSSAAGGVGIGTVGLASSNLVDEKTSAIDKVPQSSTPSISNNSLFSFGSSASTTSAPVTQTSTSTASSSSNLFAFGSNNAPSVSVSSSDKPKSSSSGLFSFGTNNPTPVSTGTNASSSSGGLFAFGNSAAAAAPTKDNSTSSTFSFNPSTNLPPPSSATAPFAAFGVTKSLAAPSGTSATPSSPFQFVQGGVASSEVKKSTTTSAAPFGSASVFGSSVPATSSAPATGLFGGFGTQSSSTTGIVPPQSNSVFGQSVPNTSGNGTSTATPFSFGGTTASSITSGTGSVGNQTTGSGGSSSLFSFGTGTPSASSVGGGQTAPAPSAATFSFVGASPATTGQSSQSVFGSNASQPAGGGAPSSSGSTFSFMSSAAGSNVAPPPATTAGNPFQFGSSTFGGAATTSTTSNTASAVPSTFNFGGAGGAAPAFNSPSIAPNQTASSTALRARQMARARRTVRK